MSIFLLCFNSLYSNSHHQGFNKRKEICCPWPWMLNMALMLEILMLKTGNPKKVSFWMGKCAFKRRLWFSLQRLFHIVAMLYNNCLLNMKTKPQSISLLVFIPSFSAPHAHYTISLTSSRLCLVLAPSLFNLSPMSILSSRPIGAWPLRLSLQREEPGRGGVSSLAH